MYAERTAELEKQRRRAAKYLNKDSRRSRPTPAARAVARSSPSRKEHAMPQMTMVKALNQAMAEAMREDRRVMVLGQDVGQDEGVFRVTEGLLKEFGPDRCIDTPLAEAAIIGAGIGLAFTGFLPVCEMQFDGFSFQAFHQVENHARRFRNRTRGRYTARWSSACPTAAASAPSSTTAKRPRRPTPTWPA
jgi:hypothetical protein